MALFSARTLFLAVLLSCAWTALAAAVEEAENTSNSSNSSSSSSSSSSSQQRDKTAASRQQIKLVSARVNAPQAAVVRTPPWLVGQSGGRAAASDVKPPRINRPAASSSTGDSTLPGAAAAAPPPPARRFIVQLKTPSAAAAVRSTLQPIATTTGSGGDDEDGIATSTRYIRTSRITPQAAAASAAVLSEGQAVAAAAGVSDVQVTHRYSYALSGFAVENPSPAQLQALAADPSVLSVVEDRRVSLATYTTPQFLKLTGSGARRSSATTFTPQHHGGGGSGSGGGSWGLWDQLGGVLGKDGAGENVVVGVIDTGIWMANHASFAESNYWTSNSNSGGQRYRAFDDFRGVCTVAEGSPECNNKVLGCRYYTAGQGGDQAVRDNYPNEILSCKDTDGHGSHTAGTAAGNFGATASIAVKGGLLSGMAPRARISVYKVFFNGEGYEVDIVSAIEDAIKDGVDVINYSVSGDTTTFRGPINMAFLNAARAGIFAAVAGGNAGPAQSVQNISPWCTSVAASTHDRVIESTLSLGDGTRLTGSSGLQDRAVGPLPLFYAADLSATANNTLAAQCQTDSLDESKLPGPAIIACDRGGNLFTDKTAEVLRVGGSAMVILHVPGGRTDMVSTSLGIPYVMLTVDQRGTVVQYARKAGAQATVSALEARRGVTAPAMAEFSSRGPAAAGNGIVLKPDITAPGVEILAAYSEGYEYVQGTSMATPHIAGVAALIKDKYPSWSPMMIKSALMTTAYTTTRTGTTGQRFGTPVDYGAGHVDPTPAMNPGLVFDSDYKDWQRFLCDVEPLEGDNCASLCAATTKSTQSVEGTPDPETVQRAQPSASVVEGQGEVELQHNKPKPSPSPPPTGPSSSPCAADSMNVPWIAGEVAGTITVQRTLKSVLSSKEGRLTFKAAGSADAGSSFTVEVSPKSFKVGGSKHKSKRQQTVTITVKPTSSTAMATPQFGQVVWTSKKGHSVRIPLSLSFNTFSAPAFLVPAQRTPAFTYTYKVNADAATTVTVKNSGFGAATVTPVTVSQSENNDYDAPGVGRLTITVPAGNSYFGVAIFSSDVEAGANVDLILMQGDTVLGSSATEGSSSEFLEAEAGLPAGQYTLLVPAISLQAASATVYVHTWMFPSSSGGAGSGSLVVSPPSVQARPGDRTCCPITLSFSGLDFVGGELPKRYVGVLDNSRGDAKEVPVPRTTVYLLPGY